jgi:hypothetical protein
LYKGNILDLLYSLISKDFNSLYSSFFEGERKSTEGIKKKTVLKV